MVQKDNLDILGTIEDRFEKLSPQLQIGARYILDSPADVAVYSMREIASRAAVKPSTMVRLADKLGFENYNLLRDAFRSRYADPTGGYAARARHLQMRAQVTAENTLVDEMLTAEQGNIQKTLEGISDLDLEDVARELLAANVVHIIGLRKCYPLAIFFQYATRIFLKKSRLISGQAGMFREEIMAIEAGDMVVAAAFDPYTRETVEAVKQAQDVGAKVVAITDAKVSPLATCANHTFIVANRSPSFYRSLTGAMVVAQSLVAAILTLSGEEGVKALEETDQQIRGQNTYWNN